MLKKFICVVAIIGILLSGFLVPSLGAELDPNTPSSYFSDTVPEAISIGFVPEDIQGDYRKPITRSEFARLFVNSLFTWQKNNFSPVDEEWYGTRAITKEDVLNNVKTPDYNFVDVNDDDIKLAYILGLTKGTGSNTFSPDIPITRQEGATMLINYFHDWVLPTFEYDASVIKDLDKCADFAKESVMLAWQIGFFEGVSGNRNSENPKIYMDPTGYFTREQAITIMLRLYKSNSMYLSTVLLRGKVAYAAHALKMEWAVTKDSVTAVRFKDGMSLRYSEDVHHHYWNIYKGPNKKYPFATSEQKVAAFNNPNDIFFQNATEELVDAACNNVNAVFDLGYAEYEIHGDGFIYQYRFKNNGVYNDWYYGGVKELPIPYTRIR